MPVSAGAGTRRMWPYTPVWRPTPSAKDSLAIVVWNIFPRSIVACCSPTPRLFVLYYQRFTSYIQGHKSHGVVFAQHFAASTCLIGELRPSFTIASQASFPLPTRSHLFWLFYRIF